MPVWQSGKTRMWSLLKPSLFVVRYSRILATCHYWARLSQQQGEKSPSAYINQSPNRRFHGSSCSRWSVQQPVVDHLETATVCIKTSKKLLWSLTCLAIRKWCVAQLTTGWLVTGTLVRLSMKHKVGFGVDDLKSFIVSCLLTLPSLINLYSITRNKKKILLVQWPCSSAPCNALHLSHINKHPMNRNKQTSR